MHASRRLTLGLVLVLLPTILACARENKAAPAAAPAPPKVPVSDVVQRDVPLGMEVVAQLSGQEDVEIRARVEGYLRSIDYTEGSEVKKGDLLFTIDDQSYRASLAQAQASLARAESQRAKAVLDVQRFTPLAKERAISQAELDNAIAAERSATAQVEAQRAMVQQARLDVGYARITAPVTGLAGRAERKVGDLVGRGESTLLTTVSTVDPIRVSVAITEADYLRFARGLVAQKGRLPEPAENGAAGAASASAQLELADGSIHPHPGKLLFVDRAVDSRTGTLRIDLAFANPDKALRPGQYGKLRFTSETRRAALLVPQRAVQEVQGTYLVYVVGAGNKVEARKVKPGRKIDGGLWLMDEGLKPGEKVAVEGLQRLKDGAVVEPVAVARAEQGTASAEGKGTATAEGK
jgi:membrane fusion protein (multidrug efflux system)